MKRCRLKYIILSFTIFGYICQCLSADVINRKNAKILARDDTIITNLCDYSSPINQREAINLILQNPKKFKPYLLEYLNVERDFGKRKEWPSEAVLYTVGFTQDPDYFEPLISILKHRNYSASSCIYYCGIAFSIVLTCPENGFNKIVEIDSMYPSSATYDILTDYQKFRNTVADDYGKRKSDLAKTHNYTKPEEVKLFRVMQEMSINELLRIAKDDKKSNLERLNAITVIEYLAESEDILDELLVLLIQSSKGAANLFVGSCYNAIMNILIRNRNK